MNRTLGSSLVGLVALAMAAIPAVRAGAATMEQAMAQCRDQYSPKVRECVREKLMANRGTGPE